jgi:hypothetical protein
MKKRIVIAITLVLAVGALAATPLVLADGPQGRFGGGMRGHGFGPLGHIAHIKSELDQRSAGRSDQDDLAETREQTAPYREQLHGGYKSVAQKLLENPNDVAGAQASSTSRSTPSVR